MSAAQDFTGCWVTDDGHIRHDLLPGGRYVEARGARERAYEGRYEITGTHISSDAADQMPGRRDPAPPKSQGRTRP